MSQIQLNYQEKKSAIKQRLKDFQNIPGENYFHELLFCLLTPGSKAQKCQEAIEFLKKEKQFSYKKVNAILRSRTRFHNNKTKRVLEAKENWKKIEAQLSNENIPELRNWLAENVNGLGLKEAGHFLRNIGKSNNQIAILDRHILKNLKKEAIISEEEIKSKNDYLKKEKQFLEFSKVSKIPIDELDLLWWSNENGEIFK